MGGSSVVNPLGHNFLGGGDVGRALGAATTFGGSEFAKSNPFGVPINNPLASVFGNGPGSTNPYVSGPFSLDPNQVSADQSSITGLGKQQYDQTLSQIPSEVAGAIQQQNPQIMESLNSQGLLNSSAYPQEIARQQSYLTQNLALPAMQALQGTQTAGLQRGLSLEDFINQANVAKTIGAQMAPQAPSSKAQAGTFMQGVGALAPFAKMGKV